jgi:serine/threonine protein kinase
MKFNIQSQIIHKNIVWLKGCCLESDPPVLVYEFLPRGTLDDVLHRDSKVPLNLDVRLKIVAESAQGLAYLHSQAHSRIRHGNIKPATILLDENFMPKIAGFRLASLIGTDTHAVGDICYTDLAYGKTGLLTEKSDVYSLGIVILEVITRKKATRSDNHSLVRSFLEVHKKGKKSTELFDKDIAVAGNMEILDYLAEIAIKCISLNVDQRPSMTDVAAHLLTLQRHRRLRVVRQ